MTDLNSGVDISVVVGPDTYEYVAAKAQPLPFNKESRDWIYEVPLNLGAFKIPVPSRA